MSDEIEYCLSGTIMSGTGKITSSVNVTHFIHDVILSMKEHEQICKDKVHKLEARSISSDDFGMMEGTDEFVELCDINVTPLDSVPEPAFSVPEPAFTVPEPAFSVPEPAFTVPEPAFTFHEPTFVPHRPTFVPHRPTFVPQEPIVVTLESESPHSDGESDVEFVSEVRKGKKDTDADFRREFEVLKATMSRIMRDTREANLIISRLSARGYGVRGEDTVQSIQEETPLLPQSPTINSSLPLASISIQDTEIEGITEPEGGTDVHLENELQDHEIEANTEPEGGVPNTCGSSISDKLAWNDDTYVSKGRKRPGNWDGRKFPCDICGLNLSTRTALHSHTMNMHRLEKRKCPECKKLYNRKYLKTHREKVHSVGIKKLM